MLKLLNCEALSIKYYTSYSSTTKKTVNSF